VGGWHNRDLGECLVGGQCIFALDGSCYLGRVEAPYFWICCRVPSVF